jgi:hypothetical protein
MWIRCKNYTEIRDNVWVNMDHVVSIRGHDNGSVLKCAVRDQEGPLEIVIWDRPEDILARALISWE